MTPLSTLNLLRALFVILTFCLGVMIGEVVLQSNIQGGLLGLCFGLLIVLADRLLKGISLRLFSSATFGLLVGFIFARLLLASDILHYLAEETQWMVGLLTYSALGYIGMMLAMRANRDEFALLIPYVRFRRTAVQDAPIIVDTNVIIDARIRDLCGTGFLSNSLIIPKFILEELQRLADSNDPVKKERGKRGLNELDALKSSTALNVVIHEALLDDDFSVDAKLISLAKLMQARLLTNDANLCKIARLQGLQVLNTSELKLAMRTILTSGDIIQVSLVKEGREPHQAVAYLEDGTMIVVNNASTRIGSDARVTISSTLQTTAGRLAFAELQA